MTGPADHLAGVVRTDVDQAAGPDHADHLDQAAAALADQLAADAGRTTMCAPVVDEHTRTRRPAGPDAQPLAETAAAVAALRSYIAATTTGPARPGAAAVARAAVATLDHATSGLVPVATAAARLNISDDLARHLIATGALPSVQLSPRTTRVPAAALCRLSLDAAASPAAATGSAA